MVKDISVILPARNEETNLNQLVTRLLKQYDRHFREIIIIDDCSTDSTFIVANYLKTLNSKIKLIRRKSQPGVGNAIKSGLKHLSPLSKYVLLMDSDFLVNVPDIAKFIKNIKDNDGVVGSRFILKHSLKNYPLTKLVANRIFHFLTRIILGVKQLDLTNNFKLYRIELVKKIYPLLISPNFSINAELGYYPFLLGAKIAEIPVLWQERNSSMGLSKFKILLVGPSYAKIFLRLIWMKFFHLFK